MTWTTETNLTPGPPASSYQSNKNAVAFVEEDWLIVGQELPCVRGSFDFTSPYDQVGAEANVYLRRISDSVWIRAQAKLKAGNKFDFSVIQNFGTDLSQDPNVPITPWTQVEKAGPAIPGVPIVWAIEEDGSGGWYIAGEFDNVYDNDGTPNIGFGSVIHINSDGSFDSTFNVKPNGYVYCLKRVGTSLLIGGNFTLIDTPGNYGGPYAEERLAWVNGTTGAPVDVGFTVNNGTVYAIDYVPMGVIDAFDYVIFGGDFTQVNSVARSYISRAILNPGIAHDTTWDVGLNAKVRDLVSDGSGIWIGGDFTNKGRGMCHVTYPGIMDKEIYLRKAGGTLDGQCYALKYNAARGTIYAGGDFDRAGIVSYLDTRNHAAEFSVGVDDSNPSILTSWNPNCNDIVWAIETTDSYVMLGGDFTSIGSTSRAYGGEVSQDDGSVQSWDPNFSPNPVAAFGWDSSGVIRLAGGAFGSTGGKGRAAIASYKAVPATGLDTIVQVNDIPLPSTRKLTIMMEQHCGGKLKSWLMESESGRLMHYKERVVTWQDDTTARVETGPAGIQGPKIEDAILKVQDNLTCVPETDVFASCAGGPATTIEHFIGTHLPEYYPGITHDVTYTGPRGWAAGVSGLNPPNQRPARWWHEIVQPNQVGFLPALELAGDLTMSAYQFNEEWCLGVLDIRGHPSGYLNQDNDPVSQRWVNILLAGNKTVVGSTVTFEGLSVRIDFKRSAMSVGWVSGAGVTKLAAKRAYKSNNPTEHDIIFPGSYAPNYLDWVVLDNLDQWVDGLSLAIGMDCANSLTIDLWGVKGSDSAILTSQTLTFDPINVDPTGFNTELFGSDWGVFAYMEGVNQASLDDDENSKIIWNELQADEGALCGS